MYFLLMFLALKITQAVLKYNDIHWTIVWKDNSVQGGYSSSSCTQRLERKCRGFSVLDMCTLQSLFKKNNVTQRRLHLHIKIRSFMSAEPARQNRYPKCTQKNTFYGLPRNTLSFKFNWSWKTQVCKNLFFLFFQWQSLSPINPWHLKIL